jgi:hypothetical protein
MGVTYKLKPETIDFILEQKKTKPALSCRQISALTKEKFSLEVSKSSINHIIKQAGLSMPVGRRLKRPKLRRAVISVPAIEGPLQEPVTPIEIQPEISIEKVEEPLGTQCTGAIFLKAADYIMGGSGSLAEAIKNSLTREASDIITITELLIYLQLNKLDIDKISEAELKELLPLVGRRITGQDIVSYHNELQSVKTLLPDLIRAVSSCLREVRCFKVNYPDDSTLYLDGQLHTAWSTPHIPFDLSSTIYNVKSYINNYLYRDSPFILFMAPGFETPTPEFFNFILNLNKEKSSTRIILLGNRFEELEVVAFEQSSRRNFIFGLWPWQFSEYRKVRNMGEFQPFYSEPLKRELFLAQINMELSQSSNKQPVTLRGVAIKSSLDEKIRLVILSNLDENKYTNDYVANTYINHWPNFEEAFQDFNRKIELFTYTANSQSNFSAESLKISLNSESGVLGLFKSYSKCLDLYVKWHFLPSGSEELDFSAVKERFYDLKAKIESGKDYCALVFLPPSGYPYSRELEYACRRVNEKEIKDSQARKIWLSVSA